MERHQRKRQRLLPENPADRIGLFRTPDRGAAVDRSGPLPMGEGAVHARPSRADTNLDPRLRPNRTLEICALRSPAPLSARKGPQPAEQLPFRSPDEEDPPVRGYEPEDNGHRPRGPRPRRDRQLSFLAGRTGQAKPFDRTAPARRRDGRANRGTELHQCLVEGTRPLGGNEPRGNFLNSPADRSRRHILANPKQASNHAYDVSVHGGHRKPEGDAGHRTGGVRPHPRERRPLVVRGRDPPPGPPDDRLGPPLQGPGPPREAPTPPSRRGILPGGG